MQRRWTTILVFLFVALSGCSQAPDADQAPQEEGGGADPDTQVGDPGDPTTQGPSETGGPDASGIAVTVTPRTDNAYIPYFAEFSYEAEPLDADGQDNGETVQVALASESLALDNGTEAAAGTIRFLVDRPGEHAVAATFGTDSLEGTTILLNATGLYEPLNATVTSSPTAQMLAPHAVVHEITGGLGREDENFTYTCTWTGADAFTFDGCGATLLADSAGPFNYTLSVTDGVTSISIEGAVEASVVQATGDIAGSYTCFGNPALAYNSVIATATGLAGDAKPKYIAGVDVLDCRTRFTSGPGIDENTPAFFFVLDADLNVVYSEPGQSAIDRDSTGTADGFAYSGVWEIPEDQEAGEYQLLIRLDLGDGTFDWVSHNGSTPVTGTTNASSNGGALIDVISASV